MKTKSLILLGTLIAGSAISAVNPTSGSLGATDTRNIPDQSLSTPGDASMQTEPSDGAILEQENSEIAGETLRDIDEAEAQANTEVEDFENQEMQDFDETEYEMSDYEDESEFYQSNEEFAE